MLVADGMGPVLRWDGFTPQTEQAGVAKPTAACSLAGSGSGNILGTYRAYVRFVDAYNNVSDLSPVSADLVAQTGGGTVTGADTGTPITLTIPSHGLASGARIKVQNVQGQTGANGVWDIVAVDANRVSLTGSASAAAYTTGGSWVAGVHAIVYSAVPAPNDPQVRRRQLLRNTDGQATTYYVDVDTTDLSATTFTSTLTDGLLAAGVAQPVTNTQGVDLANLHARPPQNKCFMAHQQNRMFYAGEVEYSEGAVAVTFGSTTVTGIGTEWLAAVAGRFLYVVGSNAPYEIKSVDTVAQSLVLLTPYVGSTDAYASYAIRPPPAEARLVYYSEAGQCESVPVVNALSLPDDGDQVTGLMSHGSFLYILERRHIYRLTFQDDPATDGAVFLAERRGCINQRCWAIVESSAYMLDESGIHVFQKGSSDGSISTPILSLFQRDADPKINWSASRWFHCVHDPATEVIRWFVCLAGHYLPRHAICFQYTLQRWWLEEYSRPIGSSSLGKMARQASASTWGVGPEQVFLGSTARSVLALSAGGLDGPNPDAGATHGSILSAGRFSITGAATFASDVVGTPVAITAGRGKGQVRTITAASGATLSVLRPWLITPDTTSIYQVGAIPWKYKSGWFRWADGEENNSRRVELMFVPNLPGSKIYMRRFRDRSDTPIAAGISRSDDGVKSIQGSGDLEISADRASGFVQSRFDGSKEQFTHGQRLIDIELVGYGGPQAFQLYGIAIDGVES